MKIKGMFHVANTKAVEFYKTVLDDINELQDNGQTVEVQYQVNNLPSGQMIYSALILGRKNDENR